MSAPKMSDFMTRQVPCPKCNVDAESVDNIKDEDLLQTCVSIGLCPECTAYVEGLRNITEYMSAILEHSVRKAVSNVK